MRMRIAALLVLSLCLNASGIAFAREDCDTGKASQKLDAESDTKGFVAKLRDLLLKGCLFGTDRGSLNSVLSALANQPMIGGKRLEEEKPLNMNEAQANLKAALRDPGIRARVENMRRTVKDEEMRLLYEAAILDEEGYYNARELLIHQLRQRLH